MKLSDDKISHTSHVLLKGLLDHNLISLKIDASDVRREIKRTIVNELKAGDELDEAVVRKLNSFSKKIVEGSSEWEVLYKKFYEEEEVRRGRK
jgi:hypothetical protein